MATIDQPLPPRLQTILSYRVDPAVKQRLDGGAQPSPVSRRDATRAVLATGVVGSPGDAGTSDEPRITDTGHDPQRD